ncbi:hypothetical protein [Saccharopolyspora rosea]|uniref:Uncharacterized protein n=1 Tax=Saccharopolyspora rosea TaxID=524884 RepID=A0ABW3G079_9PSEU|nr:hypothetical protein [Saccharopolyspora rosea]
MPDQLPESVLPPSQGELDPVRGFLGCLMTCPVHRARELLAGMRPTDAGPGIRSLVFELILTVVAAGIDPDPRVLLGEARRRGLLDTEDRHKQVTHWIFDTYQFAPFAEAGARLKADVLEGALRWRLAEHALRLHQAAGYADIGQLRALADLDDDLVDLWQRYDAELRAWEPNSGPSDIRRLPRESREAA